MARPKAELNIQEVALKSGVSAATVSRVLNNRSAVSLDLRKNVMKVAREMGFTPQRGNTRVPHIGVVQPTINPCMGRYQAEIIDGAIASGAEHNFAVSVMIYQRLAKWPKFIPQVRNFRFDGVIVIAGHTRPQIIDELSASGIPTMLINEICEKNHVGWVDSDASVEMQMALDHLFSLGHRNIGYLNHDPQARTHRLREECFRRVMSQDAVPVPESWIAEYIPTELSSKSGFLACTELLKRCPELTAVVAVNDEMALGALAACADLHLKVPQDISIIGIDGLAFGEYLRPALTTIAQPVKQFGFQAAMALAQMLRLQITELPRLQFPASLIVRGSCGKMKIPRAMRKKS